MTITTVFLYTSIFKVFASSNISIKSTIKLDGSTSNGATLSTNDVYGAAVTNLGDFDSDGVPDLLIGAQGDSSNTGAVYIHFMNTDGSIKSSVKLDGSTSNGATLSSGDYYGAAVADLNDLDGDGVDDLAIGTFGDNSSTGAVYIHFMHADGSIKSTVKLDGSTSNGATLSSGDEYGTYVANIGDLDNDGVNDIAVGAQADTSSTGAVYIHFMNADGSIKSTVKLNGSTPNGATLSVNDQYSAVASIGDLDGDNIPDIVVGAQGDNSGTGAAYIHYMNADGSIKSTVKIDGSTLNGPDLTSGDAYGGTVSGPGDLNDDGVNDLAVGSYSTNNSQGAISIHFMNSNGTIKSTITLDGSTTNGASLVDSDGYSAFVAMGDLNGDGFDDFVVGAYGTNSSTGAVYIHFMDFASGSNSHTFNRDTRCNAMTPPAPTWIQLKPDTQNGIKGMQLTWSQNAANFVNIRIDDGTNKYPWQMYKMSNDGHEFLPNVFSWQNIVFQPQNVCKKGTFTDAISFSKYSHGWPQVATSKAGSNVLGAETSLSAVPDTGQDTIIFLIISFALFGFSSYIIMSGKARKLALDQFENSATRE